MKIKVSEASGVQLDWLVAKAEGWNIEDDYWITDLNEPGTGQPLSDFQPTTDPAQGQPILERERIKTAPNLNGSWHGQIRHTKSHPLVAHPVLSGWTNQHGPTMLTAGLRCFVASKLGDEVEIPEELS